MEWCNSGGLAPATPGLTVHLPQIAAVAMGGPVCDPVRSTTTKPITDHDPHLPGVNYRGGRVDSSILLLLLSLLTHLACSFCGALGIG
jgi:hypothetical protein